jgi:hypothetical protein
MGLYVRVFCTSQEAPTARAAFEAANEKEVVFTVADDAVLDDPIWNQINLTFIPSDSWAVLECDRDNDLVRAEIHETSDEIGPAGRSTNKKLILDHLQATRFIVSCQLPFDYPDRLWGAAETLLDHVVAHHEGMLQVDNVGIYLGERLAWKSS